LGLVPRALGPAWEKWPGPLGSFGPRVKIGEEIPSTPVALLAEIRRLRRVVGYLDQAGGVPQHRLHGDAHQAGRSSGEVTKERS
jgi:hypothetical protein